MGSKVKSVLNKLTKAAAILAVVADAGKKVISLIEG